MKEVGFAEVELAAETGFNSSPITKGALFRAVKPAFSQAAERGKTMEDSYIKYRMFFDSVYAEGAIDRKTKHLIALGASLGAGCEA
jgi:alkylhydroperoxidase/carboxymuconolactone decarboxylase family protein YurZ